MLETRAATKAAAEKKQKQQRCSHYKEQTHSLTHHPAH